MLIEFQVLAKCSDLAYHMSERKRNDGMLNCFFIQSIQLSSTPSLACADA